MYQRIKNKYPKKGDVSMKLKHVIFGCGLILCFGFLLQSWAGKGDQPEKHPDVDFTMSCRDCHKETTPDIYKQWAGSGHGKMNFGCYLCHGDGEETFHVKPATDNCMSCHSDQDVDFSAGKFDSCFDCHNGHSLTFHNQ
jgi:hypothetical protein